MKGWTQRRLEQSRIEWKMHTVAIVLALGTSTAAVSMGLFNSNIWDCWIASVPFGCRESWLNNGQTDCIRGDNSLLYRWVFFYVPLWVVIITVTVIMILIVRKFRAQEKLNRKWRSRSVGAANQSIIQSRNPTKEIGTQCIFYVGSFYLTWIFPSILRITELTGSVVYYHWVQIAATLIPCQGMFNLIVYLRPQFVRIKAQRKRDERRRQQEKERESATKKLTSTAEESGRTGDAKTDDIVSTLNSLPEPPSEPQSEFQASFAESDLHASFAFAPSDFETPAPPDFQASSDFNASMDLHASFGSIPLHRKSLLDDDSEDTSERALPSFPSFLPPHPVPSAIPNLTEEDDEMMEPVPPPPAPLRRGSSFFSTFVHPPPLVSTLTRQGSRMFGFIQDLGEVLQNGDGGAGGRSLLDDDDESALQVQSRLSSGLEESSSPGPPGTRLGFGGAYPPSTPQGDQLHRQRQQDVAAEAAEMGRRRTQSPKPVKSPRRNLSPFNKSPKKLNSKQISSRLANHLPALNEEEEEED